MFVCKGLLMLVTRPEVKEKKGKRPCARPYHGRDNCSLR
jgi:hypothetical protein